MAELISVADVSTMSSLNPIYIGNSAHLALPARNIHAILRRAKSMGSSSSQSDFLTATGAAQEENEGGHARGRTSSPVHANSKRRRSAAPITGLGERDHYRSEVDHSIDLPSLSRGSVEPSSHGIRYVSSRASSHQRSVSRETSNSRSPSRGRTSRRKDALHLCSPGRAAIHRRVGRSTISRSRQRGKTVSSESEYSSSNVAISPVSNMPSYITRGIFRLYNNPGPQAFRFPKSRSQPGAAWRAGDGFSDDEATPDFMFHMTGKHRRKRSRSLSAFRELSLEVDDVAEDTAARVAHSQRRKRRSNVLQGIPHDTVMKDLWPTKENFAESLLIQRPRIMVKESIESTPLISSKSAPTVAAEMRQTIPLKRLASDFENLGKRKCRSWSTHRGQPSSSSTRASWEHDHQISNGSCMEEGNDPYEQAGDESEQERDVWYGYSQLLAESDCGDSGSEALSEDDPSDQDEDQDERMQNTVLDSQPDEVQSSIDDSCEELISNARARWVLRCRD